jgi:7,8-dihydropterin-6-yl-methyl-4-(beta-D-ribofuranosyl)aminobenzene 5'-phosphate synthase
VESDFFLKKGNEITRDTLADDQCLILESAKGLVVLLGCSHRGVINTLNHVLRLKNTDKIHAIMGGLHLGKASDNKLEKIIDQLRGFDLEMVGVGHCTWLGHFWPWPMISRIGLFLIRSEAFLNFNPLKFRY